MIFLFLSSRFLWCSVRMPRSSRTNNSKDKDGTLPVVSEHWIITLSTDSNSAAACHFNRKQSAWGNWSANTRHRQNIGPAPQDVGTFWYQQVKSSQHFTMCGIFWHKSNRKIYTRNIGFNAEESETIFLLRMAGVHTYNKRTSCARNVNL